MRRRRVRQATSTSSSKPWNGIGVRVRTLTPIDGYWRGVFAGTNNGPHCGTFHGLLRSSIGSVPGMKYSIYRLSAGVPGVASPPVSRSSSAYERPSGGVGQPVVFRPAQYFPIIWPLVGAASVAPAAAFIFHFDWSNPTKTAATTAD